MKQQYLHSSYISSMIPLTLIMTFIYNICNKKSEQRPFWGHKLCEVASVKVLPTFNNFILQIQMPIGEHSLKEYFFYNLFKYDALTIYMA